MFLLINKQEIKIRSISILNILNILNSPSINFLTLFKKAVKMYENIFLTGDLNVHTLLQTKSNGTAIHSIDCNLVNIKNCTKSVCGTSLDMMLTNKPKGFYNTTGAVTTSWSDYDKLILPLLKAHFKRLPTKKIIYKD